MGRAGVAELVTEGSRLVVLLVCGVGVVDEWLGSGRGVGRDGSKRGLGDVVWRGLVDQRCLLVSVHGRYNQNNNLDIMILLNKHWNDTGYTCMNARKTDNSKGQNEEGSEIEKLNDTLIHLSPENHSSKTSKELLAL